MWRCNPAFCFDSRPARKYETIAAKAPEPAEIRATARGINRRVPRSLTAANSLRYNRSFLTSYGKDLCRHRLFNRTTFFVQHRHQSRNSRIQRDEGLYDEYRGDSCP